MLKVPKCSPTLNRREAIHLNKDTISFLDVLPKSNFIFSVKTFYVFSMFYCDNSLVLWDLQMIQFCFYLHFAQTSDSFRIEVVEDCNAFSFLIWISKCFVSAISLMTRRVRFHWLQKEVQLYIMRLWGKLLKHRATITVRKTWIGEQASSN